MAGDRVRNLAAQLIRARAGGSLVDARADAPRDLAEVYRIHDVVLRALSGGRRAGAWKAIPPRGGGEPMVSPVPPDGLLRSPARAAAPKLGIEAEIAFRLDDRLEPVEALALFELCDTRLADWDNAPALWKLADFQSHGSFVVGTGTTGWRGIDFTAQRVEFLVNGERKKSATGAHPSGDPSKLVAWLVARGGLEPGDLIATGSWIGIVPVAPGDDVVARFPGIGEVRVTLD